MSSADFRNSIKVSNSLDPDQARLFIGPDLGPTCLQRLLADDTCNAYWVHTVCLHKSIYTADYIFRSIFFAGALRDSETWTKLKSFDIFTPLLKISIRQTGVHVTQRRCTDWNKLLLYSWPWSRASKIFDARRLIEVDVCAGKEVTKISLVPLDSCAYTSEELIIPSAKYT